MRQGTVAHTCYPNIEKAEAREFQVQVQPELYSKTLVSQKSFIDTQFTLGGGNKMEGERE
jgi:hypothetical protein